MKRIASTIAATVLVVIALLANAAAAHGEETPAPTPAATAPALECPAGTVPGWLDENGNATSCVDDHPCPWTDTGDCEPTSTDTPAPVLESPAGPAAPGQIVDADPTSGPNGQELAHTGLELGQWLTLLGIAIAMIAAGVYLRREAKA